MAKITNRDKSNGDTINYDLLWAREWAGLTQAEAADKLGVHRDTFSRWETGARPMPVRKLQLFLKLMAMNPQDIPKRLQYGAWGYPVGFDRTPYDGHDTDSGNWDLDAEEAALEKIEGDDYETRRLERYLRILSDTPEGQMVLGAGGTDKDTYDKWITDYEAGDLRRWEGAHAINSLVDKGYFIKKGGRLLLAKDDSSAA